MSLGAPFILNKYMSRTSLKGILRSLRYKDKIMLIIMMGYSTCAKCNKDGN